MKYCPYCMNEVSDDIVMCPKCGRNISEYLHPAHVLRQGALLNNRYLIGGLLGEGGFGITYIGMDTLLQYRVAIKEFFPNGMVNRNNTISNDVLSISTDSAKELFSKSRDNFLREARTLAKFNNESGIVAVKDFFEENHTVYIVMEYLDGITLKQYLNQVGTISPYNTVCLLMPVFNSLKKIHEKKLIHRDISPDNIMLVGEEVKLLDFGAAREFADEKSLSVMLKHGYAPMEQYRRHGIQGAWTDVYAICATMYKCITGKIPPDAPDRVFEDELKMPSELGIDIDPDFEKVLKHGLALKPDERIQSIDDLLEELDSVPGIDIGNESKSPVAAAENIKEITEANSNVTSAVTKDDNDNIRLSEYVPHYFDDDDEKPKTHTQQENVSPPPAVIQEQQPQKKTKSKAPLIIGAAVAVVVVGVAAAIGISMGGNKNTAAIPDESSYASSSAENTAESSKQISETESQPSEDISKNSQTPESSVESSKTEASQESSKTEVSGINLDGIKFPDIKGYFQLDENMLIVNDMVFGISYNDAVSLFKSGNLFYAKDHPLYGNEYTILYIPVETNRNTSEYVDSIDLFFKDDKLVSIEYESPTGFDNTVANLARSKFGTPTHDETDDILWMFNDKDLSYALFIRKYPDDVESSNEQVYFTQKYFTSDAAVG